MSQIDFGWIFDGFTMNLRFGIGEKSRGRVEPLFSPIPKGDIGSKKRLLLIGRKESVLMCRGRIWDVLRMFPGCVKDVLLMF